jgi:hypothetical protein
MLDGTFRVIGFLSIKEMISETEDMDEALLSVCSISLNGQRLQAD